MSATRIRWRAVVAAGALAGAAVLLGGCGVTSQDRPVRIDRKEVPFGLLRDAPPATSPDIATPPTTAP